MRRAWVVGLRGLDGRGGAACREFSGSNPNTNFQGGKGWPDGQKRNGGWGGEIPVERGERNSGEWGRVAGVWLGLSEPKAPLRQECRNSGGVWRIRGSVIVCVGVGVGYAAG